MEILAGDFIFLLEPIFQFILVTLEFWQTLLRGDYFRATYHRWFKFHVRNKFNYFLVALLLNCFVIYQSCVEIVRVAV